MPVACRIKPRVAGVLPQETSLRVANERTCQNGTNGFVLIS